MKKIIALSVLVLFLCEAQAQLKKPEKIREVTITKIQNYGLELYISYRPNFILDAWKIDKVTLTLEFKDITGKPHSTLATVVIPFVASPLLKDGNATLKCVIDKFLLAKS
jgi:hypothetical protein